MGWHDGGVMRTAPRSKGLLSENFSSFIEASHKLSWRCSSAMSKSSSPARSVSRRIRGQDTRRTSSGKVTMWSSLPMLSMNPLSRTGIHPYTTTVNAATVKHDETHYNDGRRCSITHRPTRLSSERQQEVLKLLPTLAAERWPLQREALIKPNTIVASTEEF
jgi:hypothetical protein